MSSKIINTIVGGTKHWSVWSIHIKAVWFSKMGVAKCSSISHPIAKNPVWHYVHPLTFVWGFFFLVFFFVIIYNFFFFLLLLYSFILNLLSPVFFCFLLFFLCSQADLGVSDNEGRTALHYTVSHHTPDCTQVITEITVSSGKQEGVPVNLGKVWWGGFMWVPVNIWDWYIFEWARRSW